MIPSEWSRIFVDDEPLSFSCADWPAGPCASSVGCHRRGQGGRLLPTVGVVPPPVGCSYVGRNGGKLDLLEKRRRGLVEVVAPPATVRLAHRGVETLRGAHMRNVFLNLNPQLEVQFA